MFMLIFIIEQDEYVNFFLFDKYKDFLVQTKLDFKKGLYIRMKEKIKI